ncbi:hypothetical protein [Massilia sp. CCM 8734]|uniref:hypothetical protein n=1 Tax=Massilia sp. CCM 8734 TaxID=2609283 RepID=UPI0014227764|nr:hypothetical protein [Massilia sp. CCM 8734]NHZ99042.1 hypothetical protein [Massilia sp. CCM 8734]
MKKSMLTFVITTAIAVSSNTYAQDNGGSNNNGAEKVCFVGPNGQSEQGLVEALKGCKRGDILDLGWVQSPAALQLCDFTKAIVYHPPKGSVVGCVYTGTRRQTSK